MNKNETNAVILVAALVLVAYFATGGFKSIGGTTGVGSTTIPVGSYTGSQTIRYGAGFINYNKLGNPNQSVAISTVTVYAGTALTGQAPYATLAATLTGGLNQTSQTFAPGPYIIVYHNNVNYLDTYSTFTVQPGVSSTTAGALVYNYTTPTVTFGNGTVAYPTTSNTVFHVVGQSAPLVQPVLEIKAGSQNGGNAAGELVVMAYNSVAINGGSQLSPGCPGQTAASPTLSLPTPTYVNGQNNQVGYVIPQTGHNQVVLCNPVISTTTGFAQTAASNTPIGVMVYPITNYLLSGTWYPNVVVNPSTSAGTAIIAGVGSSTAFYANALS